ncbi:MAG: hypothetical protein KatS3mg111_4369 [Pirellulaceae bacterium]|nr:MAG: hypothetical protein KatS3mg111_4369 [Pirellulaceae bacterium]
MEYLDYPAVDRKVAASNQKKSPVGSAVVEPWMARELWR